MGSFKPGHNVGKSTRFKPGQSGNPGGKPKGFMSTRKLAIEGRQTVIDGVIIDPKMLKVFEKRMREDWEKNPAKAIKDYLLPFNPKFELTAVQAEGVNLNKLTIAQLHAIAEEESSTESEEA